MADENDEKQQAGDRHYETMKYLQNMRDDVQRILKETINNHYDYPPENLASEQEEREKLRKDLYEIRARVDQTLNGL
jgi:hypothetical protein